MRSFALLSALAFALLSTGCSDGQADTADPVDPAPASSGAGQHQADAATGFDVTAPESTPAVDAAPAADGALVTDATGGAPAPDAAPDAASQPQPGCAGTMADCCPDPESTCDTDLATSVVHCGKCNNPCPAYSKCVAGNCVLECETDQANCNGDLADGCETDLTSSIAHCGGCGKPCTDVPFSYKATCSAAACHANCEKGHLDCDGLYDNGCEIDSAQDLKNCGTCGESCLIAHATPVCIEGHCEIGACDPGWADCNAHAWGDGCEIDTLHDVSHCGACGHACSFAHASASCEDGKCKLGACETGWGDCNGNPADGCEVFLTKTSQNCGFCGHDCGDGVGCWGGTCIPMPSLESGEIRDLATSGQLAALATERGVATTYGFGPSFLDPDDFLAANSTAFAVAADASGVFWLEHGGLLRRTTGSGTAVSDLASGLSQPVALALDSKNVYLLANGKLGRIPKSGGTITMIASNVSSVERIAVDSDAIYTVAGAKISRVLKVGYASQLLVTAAAAVRSIQAQDGYLYWLADDEIWRVASAGGTPEHVVSAPDIADFCVGGSVVYFTTGLAVVRFGSQGIQGLALAPDPATHIALANDQLWWVAGNKAYRTPK